MYEAGKVKKVLGYRIEIMIYSWKLCTINLQLDKELLKITSKFFLSSVLCPSKHFTMLIFWVPIISYFEVWRESFWSPTPCADKQEITISILWKALLNRFSQQWLTYKIRWQLYYSLTLVRTLTLQGSTFSPGKNIFWDTLFYAFEKIYTYLGTVACIIGQKI